MSIFILLLLVFESIASLFLNISSLMDRLEVFLLAILLAPIIYSGLREFKEQPFNIDILMTIAAVSAFLIGAYHEALLVLILFNFAEYIEDKTSSKLGETIEGFTRIIPKDVLKEENGGFVETDVKTIKRGDVLLIKPGQSVPVDGVILLGDTTLDVSAITGESIPVEASAGDSVLSGSINLTSSIKIRAEKEFKDSTVSRIVSLIMEAREKKARIERFIDRFSQYYTPIIIILALLVVMIPTFVFQQDVRLWGYRALILVVLACPSAFIISTPITYFIGLIRATKSGIIVKGGIYLETLSRLEAIAFDKTGTLTENKLIVRDVIPLSNDGEFDILKLACLLEMQSNHPVARAILEKAEELGIAIETEINFTIEEIPGKGLRANIPDIGEVAIGNESLLKVLGVRPKKYLNGRQLDSKAVYVVKNGDIVGVIELEDVPRDTAREAIKQLYEIGIRNLVMLTGDSEEIAREIAEKLGIKKYYAELLPEEKVEILRKLKREYGVVSMVGDGINDAPALAASDVGIAMGAAGHDIAIQSADVAVMSNDLRRIPYLVRLSKKVQRKLKINLVLAFSIKIFLMVLGFLGFISLFVAVLGDDGLTIAIIANTLPILKYRE
ncbi:MAG: heavy metal translocating P-type ATPase [Candidatus Njordarchaeia archaeon]